VVGSRNGFFDQPEIPQICADVSDARPDLLLVAMGNPLQEKFIVEHRERLNACVAIGVGALFDFMSGSVARAPKAFRVLKLEWLYRMLQEPRRLFGRYMIGGPRFLYQILCLRFSR
jgi:exopolysaccharide biosynthesis WecB/TagA/CpsF family protein